jgi:hypothetical protein
MRLLTWSPFVATLALLAPSSMAAYGTQHAFHGTLCVPLSGSGAVYFNDGVSTGKVASGDVVCPLSRTVSLEEEGKPIGSVIVTTAGGSLFTEDVRCSLFLTDPAGLTEYSATATATTTATGGKIVFGLTPSLYSRFGRLICHLPPMTGIRSYEIVDLPW